jgi:hypothetical protein
MAHPFGSIGSSKKSGPPHAGRQHLFSGRENLGELLRWAVNIMFDADTEHRMLLSIHVNGKWYLESCADIAEAMRSGIYKSGQDRARFKMAALQSERESWLGG